MRYAVVLLCAAVAGCSSDGAPEPEPAMENPGAFLATGSGDEISLARTLTSFKQSTDSIMIFTLYDVHPSSFDDAREIAKHHDLPIRSLVSVGSKNVIMTYPNRVVWYRTLTDEERRRF